MTEPKGLTITVVCDAQSANFGEGLGNVSELKKLIGPDGLLHTYISRQALRYSLLHAISFDNTPIYVDKSVAQFDPNATITDFPEIDLFGYMKTKKGSHGLKRSAIVRLSPAISTEPFYDERDFLTNLGLFNRLEKTSDQKGLMPSQSEMHHSLYVYTLTIDLEKIGIDDNTGEEISQEEKAKRVNQLLDGVNYLYRDIRGRRENMQPLLIIGGIYDIKLPIFENAIDITQRTLNVDRLLDFYQDEKADTEIGLRKGEFKNEKDLTDKVPVKRVSEFITDLKEKVDAYYK